MKINKENNIAASSVICAISAYKKEIVRKLTNENNFIEVKERAVEFPENVGMNVNILV